MKKRILSSMVMLCMLFHVLSTYTWAAEKDIPVSGICGEKLEWTLKSGKLTIFGSGPMDVYTAEEVPWYLARDEITAVVIEQGVSSIGAHAFSGCRNLTKVTFEGDAPVIDANAFDDVIAWGCYSKEAAGWTESVTQDYGGIIGWKAYCPHVYADHVVEPTCTAQGYTTHLCTKCGESYADTFTEMTAHVLTEWLQADGYDDVLRSVCHRGSSLAPENTLAAYELAKKQGFCYVETDVQFTKDGVAVLLHDSTIDRTSDGSGDLAEYTYDELAQFDFGSWKAEKYAGTKIPTFEEFLQLCKRLTLKPYVEMKLGLTADNAEKLMALAEGYGMKEQITWISFDKAMLETVVHLDPGARVGYLVLDVDESAMADAAALAKITEEFFVDCYYHSLTPEKIERVKQANLPLEVWTVNEPQWLASMDPYISGVTSDTCLAGKIVSEQTTAATGQRGVQQLRNCLGCDYYEVRSSAVETGA